MKSLVLGALLLAFTSVVSFGQFLGTDPALKWQMIETEHFRIIFHEGTEGMAQETAALAEESFKFWAQELKYTPTGKTDIIISDSGDLSAGGATTSPNKIIFIGTSWARSFNEWLNSRERSPLEAVLYHEYGHIVDIDKVSGISKSFRDIFGSVIMPNFVRPDSFIEGMPIYQEIKRAGHERGNDPRDAMYFRTMLLHEKFPTFAQAGALYDRKEWPSTYMLSHDYGAWLMRYLGEKYGSEKLEEIAKLVAEQPLNLLAIVGLGDNFAPVIKKALGVTPKQFYDGFKDWLKEQFASQIEAIKNEGITQSLKISKLKYWNYDPSWSPDGTLIAYYHADPSRLPGIRLIQPDGKADRQLLTDSIALDFFRPPFWVAAPAWSPQGQGRSLIVYHKHEIYKNYYIYGDIYLYDLETQAEKRLTYGARAYNPVFFPDGRRILFAQQQWGEKSPRLAVLNLETKEISVLKEFTTDMLIDSFAISPDGSQVALSIWRWGGYQDIYLMPAEGGGLTPITQDRATDVDPTWSPDAKYILFSSDRDGVNNLYAYSLEDGALFKVTNTLTGAFAPDVSPERQGRSLIVFAGYGIEGYEIHTMEFNPQNWKRVELQKEELPQWPGFRRPGFPVKLSQYDPGPSLSPKFWVPIPLPNLLGFATAGLDSLFQHFYALAAGYDPKSQRVAYFFNYTNQQLRPAISVTLSRGSFERPQAGNQHSLRIDITLPLIAQLNTTQNLTMGFRISDFYKGKSALTASWALSSSSGIDLFRSRRTISIEAEAGLEREGTKKLVLDWRETLRLPFESEQELALKFTAGWSASEGEVFQLGGDSGKFLLRGYKRAAFKGNQILAASAEYRFALFSIEQGLGYWPLFFDDLRGSLFIDAGVAAERVELTQLKASVGVELHCSLVLNYFFSLSLRVGVAQALGEKRPYIYFGLGTAF